MRRPTAGLLVVAALLAPAGARGEGQLELDVALVQEAAGARTLIAESKITGPSSLDLDIRFGADPFTLEAHLVTDRADDGGLDVLAQLRTRRAYGRSPRDLPLYEEDEQRHELHVAGDEAILLVPFGGTGDDGLRVEITPAWSAEAPGPLRIDIVREAPGRVIEVHARAAPHRFACVARLLAGGGEVARAAAPCRVERPVELPLRLAGSTLTVRLTIDRTVRGRPSDGVEVRFDLLGDAGAPLATGWAGAGTVDGELGYDVTDVYRPDPTTRYELRLGARPAGGEPGAD